MTVESEAETQCRYTMNADTYGNRVLDAGVLISSSRRRTGLSEKERNQRNGERQ